eukprot:CAMPEP_0178393382 /NCGR_PEP_ID=MMETSP0689_2-20121128/12157_1 /TAXON_ID=160604 /ORGANISM="Amphidinium massartii, Strain CS-259" /LENGTH=234 /DNA_ID=CAMNT_0020013969 /DNA_START=60 /DNA_END=763 /DNA_ORIENTATION=+
MKTIGMLTGVSYVSGIDYYRGINERIAKLVPNVDGGDGHRVGGFAEYVRLLTAHDSLGVSEYLARGVKKLHAAGVDFLVIASNTAHCCVDVVTERFPDLPILHIADCTAAAAKGRGRIGLVGTKPTMEDGSWLKSRLAMHGVEVVVPEAAADLQRCYDIICEELSFNVFTDESRSFFADLVRRLHRESGAEVPRLQEIELLLRQSDVPDVKLYRSAELHIEAAAQVQAGVLTLD